ncbi:MAG: hypothetical protein ACJ75J_05785 [Cytophagaceae bacterium]
MKKIKILTVVLLMLATISYSQVGQVFPDLSGKTLLNQMVTLPKDSKGKMTLIGISYSQKSEDELTTWFQPLYTNFIEETKGNLFPDDNYDINIYIVPMLVGINKGRGDQLRNYLKSQLDPELQKYVLIYEGELKPYKDALKFGAKDAPYFYLLDEQGKIVYQTSGAYTNDKLEKIIGELDKEE